MASKAQADLDLAMPALTEAERALDSLKKNDIAEVRSYGKPPEKVQKVMEAVMILKGLPPTWEEAKKVLADNEFLKKLKNFDKDHVSDKVLKKIEKCTAEKNFDPDIVGEVSFAARGLCIWVKAIEKYAKIYRYITCSIKTINIFSMKF